MKKIPCLIKIDYTKRPPVPTEEITPGCEWVIAGEGRGTVKIDGTAVMRNKNGDWYARYECKKGKVPPPFAIPCCDPDPITGHWPHWVPITEKHERFAQLMEALGFGYYEAGTYELHGPKVNGNPHKLSQHGLELHGNRDVGLPPGTPRTLDLIREVVSAIEFEGIVFHHPDGRMCKIRRVDFGFEWPL